MLNSVCMTPHGTRRILSLEVLSFLCIILLFYHVLIAQPLVEITAYLVLGAK